MRLHSTAGSVPPDAALLYRSQGRQGATSCQSWSNHKLELARSAADTDHVAATKRPEGWKRALATRLPSRSKRCIGVSLSKKWRWNRERCAVAQTHSDSSKRETRLTSRRWDSVRKHRETALTADARRWSRSYPYVLGNNHKKMIVKNKKWLLIIKNDC